MSDMTWLTCAGVIAGVVVVAAGCTEPRGELAGCTTDQQCKGKRLCSPQGGCVSPLALHPTEHDAGDTLPPSPCKNSPTARLRVDNAANPNADPANIEVGTPVELDARASTTPAGRIVDYQWSVVDYPYAGNLDYLKPTIEPDSDGQARLPTTTLGTYVVEVDVVDDAGATSCRPARATIQVATDAEVFVEMVWDTPADSNQLDDDGPDMDLHYKHPAGNWGLDPLDVFWDNRSPDWGRPGDPSDDPMMLRDDDDGAGPETIVHPHPADRRYAVGVYYYDDYGYAASLVTIRVYLHGSLAAEIPAESLPGRDTFYEALTIDAQSDSIDIADTHYDGYPPVE